MKHQLPFSAKLSFILIALIALSFVIYIGQDIIVPVVLAIFFAIVLQPIVDFLKRTIGIPKIIGALIAVILFVALFIGIFAYISIQVSTMLNDFDKIQDNLNLQLLHIQHYIRDHFDISSHQQETFINQAAQDSIEKGKELIGVTISSFSGTVLNVFLVPIYTFLVLIYNRHFKVFLKKLIQKEHHNILSDIIIQIKSTVRNYIFGLILELIFVSVLTAIGLYIIGIKYAIVLGLITGILNLIPYIGILFAGLLTVIASLTGSSEITIIIGIIAVNVVVQLIDNNVLVPMIVSSKVQINAIATIIGILIGGALAGISGMFIAIPFMAILKVVFDRIESLEPWGYLLGDDLPKTQQWKYLKVPSYEYDNFTDTSTVENEMNFVITKSSESSNETSN